MSVEVRHVLVAEDNMATATAIRYNLEKAGFKVSVARCGQSAWKLLNERDFDLVISDFQMPGMTGGQLCEKMGQEPRLANTPMILLTAKALEPDSTHPLLALRNLGVVPLQKIMSKPFSPRELVHTARSLLEAAAAAS